MHGSSTSTDLESGEVAHLTDRRPSVTPERLVAQLVPPPTFADVSFDTYRPDPAEPSQAAAVESCRRFCEQAVQRRAGKKKMFGKREVLPGVGLYLDGGFGVGLGDFGGGGVGHGGLDSGALEGRGEGESSDYEADARSDGGVGKRESNSSNSSEIEWLALPEAKAGKSGSKRSRSRLLTRFFAVRSGRRHVWLAAC